MTAERRTLHDYNDTYRLYETKVEKVLKEIYNRPDLSWVDDWVRKLYSDEDTSVIEREHKVDISAESPLETRLRRKNDNSSGMTPEEIESEYRLTKDKILLKGEYFPYEDKCTFTLNKDLLKEIDEGRYHDELVREIKQFFVHENRHMQQNQPGFIEANNKRYTKKISDLEYLMSKQEIDAWAAEVAESLEVSSGKEAIEKIRLRHERPRSISPNYLAIIDKYYRLGGDALKKFLTEVWRYYEE